MTAVTKGCSLDVPNLHSPKGTCSFETFKCAFVCACLSPRPKNVICTLIFYFDAPFSKYTHTFTTLLGSDFFVIVICKRFDDRPNFYYAYRENVLNWPTPQKTLAVNEMYIKTCCYLFFRLSIQCFIIITHYKYCCGSSPNVC